MRKLFTVFLLGILSFGIVDSVEAQFPKIKKPKVKKPKIKKPKILEDKVPTSAKEVAMPPLVQDLKLGDTDYLRKLQAKKIWDARTYNYPEKLKACYDYVDEAKSKGNLGVPQALAYLEPYRLYMNRAPRENIYIAADFKSLRNYEDLLSDQLKISKKYIFEKGREPDWETYDKYVKGYEKQIDEIEKNLSENLAIYRLDKFQDIGTEMVAEAREDQQEYIQRKKKINAQVEERKAEIRAQNAEALKKLYEKHEDDEQKHADKVGTIVFSSDKDFTSSQKSSFKISEKVMATSILQESAANTLKEMYQSAENKDDYAFFEFDQMFGGSVNGENKINYRVHTLFVRPIYKVYVNGKQVGVATGSARNHHEKGEEEFDMYYTGLQVQQPLATENVQFSYRYNPNGKYRYLAYASTCIIQNAIFKAGPGKHTVKLELHVSPNLPESNIESKKLAEGSFTYDISNEEFEEFKDRNIRSIGGQGALHSDETVAEVKRLYASSGQPGSIQKVHISSNSYSQEFISDESLLERKWYTAQIIVNINGSCGLYKVKVQSVESSIGNWGSPKLYLYTDKVSKEGNESFNHMVDCQ